MRKPIIAIDFDGTIAEGGFPNIEEATLIEGADVYINKLKSELDCEIIIWTCRYKEKHIDEMIDFLDSHDIPYDYINENSKYLDFQPFPKIYYDVLIDDRTVLEIDWITIYKHTMLKVLGDKYNISYKYMSEFWNRTQSHIERVQKYAKKYDMEFLEHDVSKFSKDNVIPYVYLYIKNTYNKDFSKHIMNSIYQATENHIFNEDHHPEYWSDNVLDKDEINQAVIDNRVHNKKFDTKNIIKVSEMPYECIVELCSDWCAMSEELGNTPFEWADKTLGIRWDFGEKTTKLIYDILEDMWNN